MRTFLMTRFSARLTDSTSSTCFLCLPVPTAGPPGVPFPEGLFCIEPLRARRAPSGVRASGESDDPAAALDGGGCAVGGVGVGVRAGPSSARPGRLVLRPAGWTQIDVRGGRGRRGYFIAVGKLGTAIGTNAQPRRAGAPATATA